MTVKCNDWIRKKERKRKNRGKAIKDIIIGAIGKYEYKIICILGNSIISMG